MGKITEHIQIRRKQLQQEAAELDALEKLGEQFTDLCTTSQHHWGSMLTSASVNELAEKVRFVNGCSSCASDAPLEARPYLEVDGDTRIYIPEVYIVGQPHLAGFGFHPEPGWKEKMTAEGISPKAIEAVEQYLKDNPPEDDPDEEL